MMRFKTETTGNIGSREVAFELLDTVTSLVLIRADGWWDADNDEWLSCDIGHYSECVEISDEDAAKRIVYYCVSAEETEFGTLQEIVDSAKDTVLY